MSTPDSQELAQFLRFINLSNEELKDFTDSLRTLNTSLFRITGSANDMADANRRTINTLRDRQRAETDNTTATQRSTQATRENAHVVQALTETQDELREGTKALKDALGQLGNNVLDLSGTLLDTINNTSGQMNKYGNAVSKAGDLAYDLGKNFGLLGTVIGAIVKGMTIYMQKQMEFIDNSLKANDSLSQIGASATMTTDKLQDLVHASGRTMAEFDNILKPMRSAGAALQGLGGDAARGAENFIKMTNVGEKVRSQYRSLGISFEELTQHQGDFLAIQRMSGRAFTQQEIDSGKVRRESLRYVDTLQELSRLTGENVDSVKKQLEQAANTIQAQVINNDLLNKERNLRAQLNQATNEQERKTIQAQLELVERQKTEFNQVGEVLVAIGKADVAGSFQTFLESGKMSQELAEQFTNLGIDMDKYHKQFQSGTFNTEEFAREYQARLNQRVQEMKDPITGSFENAQQVAKVLGITGDSLTKLNAMLASGEDIGTVLKKIKTETQEAKDAPDRYEQARNAALEKEIETRVQFEKDLKENIQGALDKWPKLADATNKLYTAFDALVGIMPLVLGALVAVAAVKTVGAVAGGIGGLVRGGRALGGFLGRLRGRGPIPPGGGGGGAPPNIPPPPGGPPGGGPPSNMGPAMGFAGGASAGRGLGLASRALGLFGRMTPGVGTVMSGMDLIRNLRAGNFGGAALDALGMGLGMIPGGGVLRTGLGMGISALSGSTGTAASNLPTALASAVKEGTRPELLVEQLKNNQEVSTTENQEINKTNLKTLDLMDRLVKITSEHTKFLEKLGDSMIINLSGGGATGGLAGVMPGGGAPGTAPSASTGVGGAIGQILTTLGNSVMSFFGGGTTEPTMPTVGGMAPVTGKNVGGQGGVITKVIKAGPGYTVVETSDGKTQTRKGSRNWRNNNPGNLEYGNFAKRRGAIGHDGRFAVFPTYEMGAKAKEDLLFGPNYANLTIAQAISRYAPPSENLTRRYINEVVHATRSSPFTTLNSLNMAQRQALVSTITKMEGFKPGEIIEAKTGGLAIGPSTGYPALLHGTEMVVPLDPNSILAELGKKTTDEVAAQITTKTTETTQLQTDIVNINKNLMEMISSKLDSVINKLDTGNDTQSKLLRYARA